MSVCNKREALHSVGGRGRAGPTLPPKADRRARNVGIHENNEQHVVVIIMRVHMVFGLSLSRGEPRMYSGRT